LARRESTSRAIARSTSALAEFHDLSGHAGPADSCMDCETVQQQQRQARAALRSHQRRTRQRVDAILSNPYPNGIPAPKGACPACAYDPCVCAGTDEAIDLLRDAEADGLLGEDEPELRGEG
jgi:hypothetical protein